MLLASEGQLTALVNLVVNLLKQTYIVPGLSMFYALQLGMWIAAAAFLLYFALNKFSGGSDD